MTQPKKIKTVIPNVQIAYIEKTIDFCISLLSSPRLTLIPAFKTEMINQNSGFSLNTQLNFENIFPIKFRQLARTIGMNLYVFGDVGSLSNFDMPSFSINKAPILADAGIGTALTWKKGIKYLGLGPMTFRFDMPLFLSHPAQGENDEKTNIEPKKLKWHRPE